MIEKKCIQWCTRTCINIKTNEKYLIRKKKQNKRTIFLDVDIKKVQVCEELIRTLKEI